jgi:hypothetical protein
MSRTYRLLVGLSLVSLVLAGVSWGQPRPGPGKWGGPGSPYNPDTVVTVSGTVMSVVQDKGKQGLPYPVYLILKSEESETGYLSVFLGPNLYVKKLPVQLKLLDQVQVTGSRVMEGRKPVILAAEVKKGNQVLKFRKPDGVPYWRGHRRN